MQAKVVALTNQKVSLRCDIRVDQQEQVKSLMAKRRAVVVLGVPGMGKTSFLKCLQTDSGDANSLFINCIDTHSFGYTEPDAPTKNLFGLPEVAEWMARNSSKTRPVEEYQAAFVHSRFLSPLEFMHSTLRAPKHVTLYIDEIVLGIEPQDYESFWRYLTHLAGLSRFRVVTGAQPLMAVKPLLTRFRDNIEPLYLRTLDTTETALLLNGDNKPPLFDESALQEIIFQSGGRPGEILALGKAARHFWTQDPSDGPGITAPFVKSLAAQSIDQLEDGPLECEIGTLFDVSDPVFELLSPDQFKLLRVMGERGFIRYSHEAAEMLDPIVQMKWVSFNPSANTYSINGELLKKVLLDSEPITIDPSYQASPI